MSDTTTLWRPTGPEELALVRDSGWRAWPPRLPEQPIFYPVLNEDYAVRIAREWNLPRDGEGHVTRFHVDSAFVSRYPVRQAGGRTILELWVPAEELPEFNAHLRGPIESVRSFLPGDCSKGRTYPPLARRFADVSGVAEPGRTVARCSPRAPARRERVDGGRLPLAPIPSRARARGAEGRGGPDVSLPLARTRARG